MYQVIEKVFTDTDVELLTAHKDEVLEGIVKELTALDKKNEAARKRSAARKADGDELRGTIESLLTDEPKTVNDILAELDNETLTPAKVVARMTQLVKADKATKEVIKIDGRKLTAYVRA